MLKLDVLISDSVPVHPKRKDIMLMLRSKYLLAKMVSFTRSSRFRVQTGQKKPKMRFDVWRDTPLLFGRIEQPFGGLAERLNAPHC